MKRRAGRFSVVDHRENARTHISHLFLDPVPIARGADPHDGHPREMRIIYTRIYKQPAVDSQQVYNPAI